MGKWIKETGIRDFLVFLSTVYLPKSPGLIFNGLGKISHQPAFATKIITNKKRYDLQVSNQLTCLNVPGKSLTQWRLQWESKNNHYKAVAA